MGLTYHYKFRAAASRTAAELRAFLRTVEGEAKWLGFAPTVVFDGVFDTPERREFARRLTHGLVLESNELRGAELCPGQVWHLDSKGGSCRVIPQQGVVLVLSDEQRCETVLGFFRYPVALKDRNGQGLVRTGADSWVFEDFIKTPDPRFRTLVRRFAAAGYVEAERDDFAGASCT